MDIKEVHGAKEKIRQAVRRAVQIELEKFRKDTGLSVKFIHFSFVNVTEYGDTLPQYILDSVSLDLAIDG